MRCLMLALLAPLAGAWVVTNDQWRDHAANALLDPGVRRRCIRFTWVCGAFTPAADDLAKFKRAGAER